MTLVAISVANGILAWLTVAVALAGALAAVLLLWRVLQPILEIGRYGAHIHESIEAIGRNLEAAGELERTRAAAGSLAAGVGRLAGPEGRS